MQHKLTFMSDGLKLSGVLHVPVDRPLMAANAQVRIFAPYCRERVMLARSLEQKADGDLIAAAMLSLRDMMGANTPDPTSATVVRWSADPFAGGSYSYIPIGARESDRDLLAAPVGDRLFFCGEATMRNYAGTVHGAYLSGLRAAARLAGTSEAAITASESRRRLRANVHRRTP